MLGGGVTVEVAEVDVEYASVVDEGAGVGSTWVGGTGVGGT